MTLPDGFMSGLDEGRHRQTMHRCFHYTWIPWGPYSGVLEVATGASICLERELWRPKSPKSSSSVAEVLCWLASELFAWVFWKMPHIKALYVASSVVLLCLVCCSLH